MKKTLSALFICFLALPCFAVPGEYTVLENGVKICDNSDLDAYYKKLDKEFRERHKGSFTGEDHTREVMLPFFKYSAELQKQGHCGFKD